MRQLVRDLRRHRVGGLAFLALWAAFWAWVIAARITGAELDLAPLLILPALPLLAGALLGWWSRQRTPEPGTAETVGAAFPGLGTALAVGAVITAIPVVVGLVDAWRQVQANQGSEPPPPPFSAAVWGGGWWGVVPGLLATLLGYAVSLLIGTWWAGRGGHSPRGREAGASSGGARDLAAGASVPS